MQLAIKKKKYFFEILKKKSLNPELNNTSYDKGKKKIPSTKIFKKKFTHIQYQYFTTKKKKDFSIEIFKKKSRNLAFDINASYDKKKERFLRSKYFKKSKFIRIRYQYFTTKEKKGFLRSKYLKKSLESRNPLVFDINIEK